MYSLYFVLFNWFGTQGSVREPYGSAFLACLTVADRASAKRGSEARAERGGSRAKRPLETRMPGPKDMMREVSWEGGVQLTESAGAAPGECGGGGC